MSLDGEAIAFWLKWGATAAFGLALVFAFFFAMVRTFAKPQEPLDSATLLGATGTAATAISRREGKARVNGHLLRAIADEEIPPGAPLKILQIDGLVAKVGLVR